MQLNQIFAKDVQRPIEGVIKADDAAHLGTEVEEYVLTNEAAKGLDLLMEAYTNYTNANGVWISGFFGSGKSHLLKMLAHLLGDVEGQDYSRASVAEIFKEKAADNAFLTASLTKAERIPAKSILFNIDQKATLISKDQADALLRVFVKVFDESRGYYGEQGHIARFEQQLDEEGQLDAFKVAFQELDGRTWEERRPSFALPTVRKRVDEAYARVNGLDPASVDNILKTYQDTYAVSIDRFAEEVKAWLDNREPGFRLNFFVDEVGQFIGSNTHLMLNLQTIAESLNTKCGGRAWIFVTSQEDMDKVLGDRTKSQGNDFSKIQARFATRVKLTSADVEEVIRKRLLTKNAWGAELLDSYYATEKANFKTLFDFVDGAKTYRNYTSEDHFIGTYPMVSYQFPLFQAAIEGISDHNVFEGRNSSVGERSMLGVVQQVAKEIGNEEVGTLATFDQMFSGIRSSLKSAAQRSIDVAERNLDDPLAIRLLKALFLVKYVDDFKATARNLIVLVYDRFGLDLPELAKQVQSSLALLEAQTYIQRNGNLYEYLTDQEQVIEAEIKNTDVDSSEVSARLNKILSGDVLKSTRIKYAKNGQEFAFGYKLDDQTFGKQSELALHFITPEYAYGPQEIRMHSAGKDELRVILDPDERVMSDLRLLLKTEKYTKRKLTSSISADQQRILQAKATQNSEREKELVERIRRATARADLVINAADVASTSQDALARVTDGFQQLISRTYTQLGLLGDRTYSEQQLRELVNVGGAEIGDHSLHSLSPAGEEVLSYIGQRDRLGEQVSVRGIVDHFQAKPYGWDLASIEGVVAWLVGTSKVTLKVDGNILKRSEIPAHLRNTQRHSVVIVEPQRVFDQRKIAKLREFCVEFFDEPSAPRDPLELAHYGREKLQAKLAELKALARASKYPFVSQLDGPISQLEAVVGHKDEWYLTDFDQADELLEAKEDVIDPISAFLNGSQRTIYDEAEALLRRNSSNLSYLPSGAERKVAEGLDDPRVFLGDKARRLKAATIELREAINAQLAATRAAARDALESRRDGIQVSVIYQEADSTAQRQADRDIARLLKRVESEEQIAVINDIVNTFEEETYSSIFDQLDAAKVKSEVESVVVGNGDAPPEPRVVIKETVHFNKVRPAGITGLLETESDIDQYLRALRSALLEAINEGKRIAL